MYKYCLFDLDGTLTDPKEGICKSAQYALHKMGIEEPDIDKLEPFIGPPLLNSFMDFYGMSKEDAEKAIVAYRERFSTVGLYENEMYPGIDELLDCLKDLGVKLAVASSKPTVFVEKILEHFKLRDYFDVVIGSNLDGSRSDKAEVVEEALLSLYFGASHEGKKLSECDGQKHDTAMIGDRKFDIEGAHAMGIAGIGVQYGYAGKGELKAAGADKIAKTVEELQDILVGTKTSKSRQKNIKNTKDVKEAADKKGITDDIKQAKSSGGFLLERNQESLPTTSFQKSIYVLTPFLLYYMVKMAVVLMGMIAIDELKKNGNQLVSNIGENSWMYSGGLSALSMLVAIVVLVGIYYKTDKMVMKWNDHLPVAAIAGLMLAMGLNLAAGYLCQAIPSLQGYLESSAYNKDMPMVVGLVAFGVLSPIGEELCFRYLMYGRMKRIYGSVAALVISSVFFGIYHGHWLQAVYAIIMGVCMALCYEWTETLLTPIVFHMIANIGVYMCPYLPKDVQRVVSSYPACVLWLVLGVGTIVALRTLCANDLLEKNTDNK